MRTAAGVPVLSVLSFLSFSALCLPTGTARASEAGQGSFVASLVPGIGCGPGVPATFEFNSTFQFDDKTFQLHLAGGENIDINFSELGTFHSSGQIQCVFDVGGSFQSTASNEAGDFQWLDLNGEYLDHKPGISEGDPFQWVAGARCETTRTDEFATLCENFQLSWNGLSKAMAPNPGYNDFDGDFNVRTAERAPVDPNPEGAGRPVSVPAAVDGPGGDLPQVEVHFHNGVVSEGELSISTLGDAHGAIPGSASFPPRGTTEIDHGDGAVAFFEGGDERFVEIHTDAALPNGPDIEVCLPIPVVTQAADVRPVRVLHGEGDSFLDRVFVDRTSSVDRVAGKACASVSSFSKFALVDSDACGNGRGSNDGILTVAGGMVGRKNVIFDGVTDCSLLPPTVSRSLARYCVPDADAVTGQCSVSIRLGVDRSGCNEVADGLDPSVGDVNIWSYEGVIRGKSVSIDLYPLFHSALVALADRTEAVLAPVTIALPSTGEITKYKFSHKMYGDEPGIDGAYVLDRDNATIACVQP